MHQLVRRQDQPLPPRNVKKWSCLGNEITRPEVDRPGLVGPPVSSVQFRTDSCQMPRQLTSRRKVRVRVSIVGAGWVEEVEAAGTDAQRGNLCECDPGLSCGLDAWPRLMPG
jgi:hypothetical protein